MRAFRKDESMISRGISCKRRRLAACPELLASGLGPLGRAAAQQRLSQADILRFEPMGQVTILHVTDIHAQLVPLHFREPSVNLGVGDVKGKPPHLTDGAFREHLRSPQARRTPSR
jgi:hypothetical protein